MGFYENQHENDRSKTLIASEPRSHKTRRYLDFEEYKHAMMDKIDNMVKFKWLLWFLTLPTKERNWFADLLKSTTPRNGRAFQIINVDVDLIVPATLITWELKAAVEECSTPRLKKGEMYD